ncbi:MAG: ATPase, T2SS/T4P/T4SS family, partial [Pirellulaceae bacterium]|nr:ATPase, T2SS/T4P/T4SS family [Pirellulaceae bacterium]
GVNTFNAAAGETPDTMIPGLMLKQPDAVVVPELHNAETVRMLCVEATEEERVIMAGVHAKESVEALLRVLLLKADAALFAKSITAVVNVRLVRKLCEECKQAFEPPPQLLQKLGIPPGRVQHLYQEWQPPAPGEEKRGQPEVCPKCGGIGYSGRTGIFEFLEVDDRIRQALVSQPKLEVLRQLARQGGNRTLQEEGILLVAQGVTSLNELQRVLKA